MISAVVIVSLLILKLGVAIAIHGQKRSGTYDAFPIFINVLLMMFLYYHAGLFNNFN